jgi:hypothetical protein
MTYVTEQKLTIRDAGFRGEFRIEVYREASGTLDFLYQLVNEVSPVVTFNAARFSLSGFGAFQTMVDYATSPPPDGFFLTNDTRMSLTAARSADGDGITFTFADNTTPGIRPGEVSKVLFLQTDATDFAHDGFFTLFGEPRGGIDPGVIARLSGVLSPAAPVPEPAAFALLGVGTLALLGYGRRRQR